MPQVTLVQDSFASGFVRDVDPHLIPPDGAYDIVNGLLTDDGGCYRRGGTQYHSNAQFHGGRGGRFIWQGYLLPGQRTFFADDQHFGVLASDDVTPVDLGVGGINYPHAAALIEDLLFVAPGFIYGGSRKASSYTTSGGNTHLTNGSKTVTDTDGGFTANVDPGMLLQRGNERVYVVASVDSDTSLTLRDNYQGATTTAVNVTFNNVYTITNADPYVASDTYAVCQNRLIYADVTTSANINGVYFTEILNPHSVTNKYNTINFHTLPEGIDILGAFSVGPTLLVFTTGGVWTIQGLALDIIDAIGNPLHRKQILSKDLILWGPGGVAYWDQILIVPCTSGVYLLDGSSAPVPLSAAIQPYFLDYSLGTYRSGGATVYRDHYFLPIISTTDNSVQDTLVCRLSRSLLDRRHHGGFPWTRISGHGGSQAAFTNRLGDPPLQQPTQLLGISRLSDSRITDCGGFFDSTATTGYDADGTYFARDIITRDFATGNGTINMVRSLRAWYELFPLDTTTELQIYYGDGAYNTGQTLWNEFNWGASAHGGNWDGSGATFNFIGAEGGNAGINPTRDRINAFTRYIRFRIIEAETDAADPTEPSSSVLRSLILKIRPSEAVRR